MVGRRRSAVGGFAMAYMANIRWHKGISGRSYDLPL